MRNLTALALLLTACGGSTEAPSTEVAADPTPAATEEAHTEEAPVAAANGATTCDQFADHMQETMDSEAEAAGDNEFMTADQAKEFAKAMVDGIRSGCTANNRLGEFPEVVSCFMGANAQAEWEACKTEDTTEGFDEYIKGLLAASLQLGAPE